MTLFVFQLPVKKNDGLKKLRNPKLVLVRYIFLKQVSGSRRAKNSCVEFKLFYFLICDVKIRSVQTQVQIYSLQEHS